MYELISVFGEVLERCTVRELDDSRALDTDTIVQLQHADVGQTIDLPGYEGAVIARRVS